MPRYGDLTNRLGTGLSRTSLNAVKRKSNFRKYSSTYSGEEGWLLQRAEKGAEMLWAPQASSTLSYWVIFARLTAPIQHGTVWGLRSRRESYRGGVSGGASGGASPCSAVPCVLSPTSTSVALCWPPGGTSIWMLLGSLAAAAPSRATSKMPSW